ncbi:hypothetical protein [Streptomyces abikoensis]
MSSELGFPVLAASAITQAFGFFYGQLASLLQRRRDRQSGIAVPDEVPIAGADILAGSVERLRPNDALLEERGRELELLAEALEDYAQASELDGQDVRLRRNLGRVRRALEEIYGTEFVIGEDQPSGQGISIRQKAVDVHDEAIGLDVESAGPTARAEVSQDIGTAHKGSKIVGARIKRLG